MFGGGGVTTTEDSVPVVMDFPSNRKEDDSESRLRWINRLLSSSASSDQRSIENGTTRNNNNNNNNNNNICLSAKSCDEAGVFTVADRDLPKGSMALSCGTEGFVLETPDCRRNYCSYCSRKKHVSSPLMFCLHCLDNDGNPMVGYCSDCVHEHRKRHIDNPVECKILQCLRNSIADNENSLEEDERTNATNQCVNEIFHSSIALLTIKLIARQLEKPKGGQATADATTTTTSTTTTTTINNNNNNNNNNRDDNKPSTTWLDKFRILYEHPLPANGPYYAIATVLASALEAVVDDTIGVPENRLSNEDLARSTLGKIVGCSHAIVDPSLPLGKQTLGRAVYVCHSFYNHSCAPNAYLSTILPSSSSRYPSTTSSSSSSDNTLVSSPRRLTARIHLLRPVQKGEEITLSYIPLSGLSRQERQERLRASYGFSCSCSVCRDKHHSLILPPNTVMADIDLIRQIQFGLNDKLHDLAEKWLKDLRYSIIRREHERICHKNSRNRTSDNNNNNGNNNNKKGTAQDPAIVLELDRIMRRIEMTQKGIANQKLPECHEVSIESDRLSAVACDLWLKSMGESLCVSIESSFESHFEFYRKTEIIQDLFDPVALGTQCLASSVSCILRAKEKQKKKHLKEQEGEDHGYDDDVELKFSIEEEIQLSGAERKRGINILAVCLGHDHPWVQKLSKDEAPTIESILTGNDQDDRKPAASHDRPEDAKRRRVL